MEKFNSNQPEFYYGIGKEIVKEGVFERFPELIPAVGENYWREDGKHKKMLLIGESNYFPDYTEDISVFKNAEKWYHADTDMLIPNDKIKDVSNDTGYPPFVRVFNIANNFLKSNGIEPEGERLHETAFYNYFLRPALNEGTGKSKKFTPKDIDNNVAGTSLFGIIDKLKPNLIIFLSKKAYISFTNYCKGKELPEDLVVAYVSHPSSPCWNKNNGVYGRQKFENLLKEYWLNK